ncbi:MAG: hypothetical protein Q8N65_02475 [bacterium]|nr:hypothetical protein [bacterium]
MRLVVHVFSAQKDGNQPEQYEDAWARGSHGEMAMSDGATEGYNAARFARAIVKAFVEAPPQSTPGAVAAWLKGPIQTWHKGIDWANLPWNAQAKAERGSMATLLGIIFQDWKWNALAIGDICLFHTRQYAMLQTFPLTRPEEFGYTPSLLYTKAERNAKSLANLKVISGQCQLGDMFLVISDALAAWLMNIVASGDPKKAQRFLEMLAGLNQKRFHRLIKSLLAAGLLKNDDVTLARIFVV